MAVDIIIPLDLWEEDTEAVITNWLAGDGATVKNGKPLVDIMVEKIQHEIRAPADGVLTISRQADDIVRKGDVIGTIE